MYYGAALALRPVPGGDVNTVLADALTGQLPGGVPASLVLLLAVVVIVWLPFRGPGHTAGLRHTPGTDLTRRTYHEYGEILRA